jgi:hypothetical protein
MMRFLMSAVIPAVLIFAVACGDKSDAVQTTPPAQGAPAAAAPAPATPPAAAAATAPAPGRQGGAAAARLTVADHAATMKTIAQSIQGANKALKGGDTATAATSAETLATSFATVETFYTQRMKPDAVKLAQTARSGAQDAAAALKAGDAMKAQTALATTQGTCAQCHKMYREGDGKATPYAFNAASGITPP